MIVTNQNCIHKKLRPDISSTCACHHSVHNHLSSCLPHKSNITAAFKPSSQGLLGCDAMHLQDEDGGCLALWNVGVLSHYTASQPIRPQLVSSLPWEPQISQFVCLWVWKRIFELKKEEVMGGWRKMYNEELQNWYSSPNIIRVNTSRRITWADI
jgi:hypothetical protein